MTTAEQDTVWHPVYGERSTIKDQYKAWSVVINRQNSRDKLVLDIRAYNEGIAFRYRFPGGQYLKITDEFTEYTLPEGRRLISLLGPKLPMNVYRWKDGPVNQIAHCF